MLGSVEIAVRVTAFVVLMVASPALAQQYERPPSFDPARISGIRAAGDNYTINNPVRSDGLLRTYAITAPYGEFTAQGDQMARMRLHELDALYQLEKISGSETFGKALVEAGISPLKYTGRLITDPKKTVEDTFGGIGAMFGRISSGMNNMGRTQSDPLSDVLGVTDHKRKLAAKFGVDPYTDYRPLSEKLSRLAEATAAGGLTVTAALMVVPGAAGIVVSNLNTVSTLDGVKLEELARDYTAEQILDLNRKRLEAMGADRALIDALLANRNYTPIDMAALVGALDGMEGVQDRVMFLRHAAQIDVRSIAYFKRRQAEMIASYHTKGGGLTRFVSIGGYPFNVARDGRIVGLMPIDVLSWTDGSASAIKAAAADARRLPAGGRVELRVSGNATALAKKQLQAMGWKLIENVKF